jgi:signal transduction histidine kinase
MTEAIYRALLDKFKSLVVLVDDKGVIRYCNQAFALFSNLSGAEAAEGKSLFQVLPFAEKDLDEIREAVQSAAVARRHVPDATMRCQLRDQKETIRLDRTVFPLSPEPGGEAFVCLILRFYSEEGTRIIYGREQNLEEIEKKVALGNLLSGFGHEIKTPLSAIICNTELMSRCIGKIKGLFEEEEIKTFLASHKPVGENFRILSDSTAVNQVACKQLVHRIQSLREFTKSYDEETVSVDLNAMMENAVTLINHLVKGSTKLTLNYGDIQKTIGYPGKLYQVFLNVLLNAIEAVKGTGEITVTTEMRDGRILVTIHDTGEGIPPEHLERIFDQGFTTKQCSGGTGLGLYISRNIIREHGGAIEIESEAGDGTTFRVFLPVRAEDRRS